MLCGAGDEILETLKNDRMKDKERKKEVEMLIGSLTDENFAKLVNLGKKITDFGSGDFSTGPADENVDETVGVNVQFEESDEEGDEDIHGEIREEDTEDMEEDEEDETAEGTLKANVRWDLFCQFQCAELC